MKFSRTVTGLTATAGLCSGRAQAHGALPGSEGFYNGIDHVFREPALLIALVAVILALLPDWPERFRMGFVLFAVGLAIGLLAGRSLAAVLPLDLALLVLALATAAAAALAGDRASAAMLSPVAGLGVLIGAALLPEPGPPIDVIVTTAGGASVAIAGVLALCGLYDMVPERLHGPVLATSLRIAAAWLCAVAAMLAALSLRGL